MHNKMTSASDFSISNISKNTNESKLSNSDICEIATDYVRQYFTWVIIARTLSAKLPIIVLHKGNDCSLTKTDAIKNGMKFLNENEKSFSIPDLSFLDIDIKRRLYLL